MEDIVRAIETISGTRSNRRFFRACNLEDVRIGIEELPLPASEKLILYQDLGYDAEPDDVLVIQKHIDYIFTRSLAGRSDRYSKTRHALYTSAQSWIAEAEMRYYARTHFFNPDLDSEPMTFNIIEINFSGLSAGLIRVYAKFPWLRARTALPETQALGDCASGRVGCLVVRSVRGGGDNGVLYRAAEIAPVCKWPDLNIMVHKRAGGRYTRKF